MSFDFDSWKLASIGISRLRGESGAALHRLLVDAVFKLPAYPKEKTYTIIEVRGEFSVKGEKGDQRYLGRMHPARASLVLETSAVATERDASFGVDLTRAAIEAIENMRMGRDLTFTIAFQGIAMGPSGLRQVNSQQDHVVNKGTWVEVLTQLDYKKLMLIEVPIPDPVQSPKLSKALVHLAEAQSAIIDGRYRDAVGRCRDVLESLSVALEDQDEKDPDVQALFENTRAMDKERRYRVVRRAMKVLSNPAHHADATADQSGWDRLDALSVVTIAAALLRRFAGVAEGK